MHIRMRYTVDSNRLNTQVTFHARFEVELLFSLNIQQVLIP